MKVEEKVMSHISEEALIDYLYDEGDAAERLKVARHLQDCAACSVAVLELQSVRGLLSEWKPPPAALGFKIVAADQEAPAASRHGWSRIGAHWPAWAQVAAGLVLFAAGVVFSQLLVAQLRAEAKGDAAADRPLYRLASLAPSGKLAQRLKPEAITRFVASLD